MKVLQVNKAYYPKVGGIEQVVKDICEELKEKIDIKVLVANENLKYTKDYVNGIEIERVPSFGYYFSTPISFNFPKYLEKYNEYDIIHFHLPNPLAVLSFLIKSKKIKSKIIITWHCDIVRQKFLLKFYKPFLFKFFNKADHIIVTSPNLLNNSSMISKFKNKTSVIPLGIDPQKFVFKKTMNNEIKALKQKYSKPIIFSMGRLVYYKGINYLIEAVKDLDVNLLIGGNGPLKKNLINLVKKLNIEHKVKFLGYIKDEDLQVYYRASDIFVLPSIEKSEAFGIVQLEAQICGTPVISTNLNTGVTFANKHDVSGLIVKKKSSFELKNAICKLLKDNNYRAKLGSQGKTRVKSFFTTELMAKKHIKLYKEILNYGE